MGCCVYGAAAEGGGREVTSVLRLEGRLCSMLTVMQGGDLDVATQVYTRILRPRLTGVCNRLSDCDTVLKHPVCPRRCLTDRCIMNVQCIMRSQVGRGGVALGLCLGFGWNGLLTVLRWGRVDVVGIGR